eukprot:TRINITY_DN1866_c0_g1_i2.p1 TRINITY_DN1866_c0_g1~~TRINITY_DN1866_c0_g1_i2.p1  ORF type:complete len:597 (-),score=147.72 TRINITY_DN1866_c0_g1_i2:113-1903(-)
MSREEESLLFSPRLGPIDWIKTHPFLTTVIAIGGLIIIGIIAALLLVIIIPKNEESNNQRPIEFPIACPVPIPTLPTSDFLAKMHKEIRHNFFNSPSTISLLSSLPPNTSALFLLVGGASTTRPNSDTEILFRQESNFLYLSGIPLPDCYILLDPSNQEIILFSPLRESSYALWNGPVLDLSQLQSKYLVDQSLYTTNFTSFISNLDPLSSNLTIFTLPNFQALNPTLYSNLTNLGCQISSQPTSNPNSLLRSIFSVRAIKTDDELTVMRIPSYLSAIAHLQLMKFISAYSVYNSLSLPNQDSNVKNPIYEYNVEAEYIYICGACTMNQQSYLPIVGAGYNSAILHYTRNTDPLFSYPNTSSSNTNTNNKDGKIILIDAAGEWNGYGSDITRTYPVSGVFSPQQKLIYEIVLDVQLTLISLLAPNVSWSLISRTTTIETCKHLIANNFTINLNISNCDLNSGDSSMNTIVSNVVRVFLPHGFGHLVGIDVHDGSSSVATLAENMVLTVEPGLYFNDVALKQAKERDGVKEWVNWEELERGGWWKEGEDVSLGFGGVRIEDVVVVTRNGSEVISGDVPKSVEEIEAVMRVARNEYLA